MGSEYAEPAGFSSSYSVQLGLFAPEEMNNVCFKLCCKTNSNCEGGACGGITAEAPLGVQMATGLYQYDVCPSRQL